MYGGYLGSFGRGFIEIHVITANARSIDFGSDKTYLSIIRMH